MFIFLRVFPFLTKGLVPFIQHELSNNQRKRKEDYFPFPLPNKCNTVKTNILMSSHIDKLETYS